MWTEAILLKIPTRVKLISDEITATYVLYKREIAPFFFVKTLKQFKEWNLIVTPHHFMVFRHHQISKIEYGRRNRRPNQTKIISHSSNTNFPMILVKSIQLLQPQQHHKLISIALFLSFFLFFFIRNSIHPPTLSATKHALQSSNQ